MRGGAALAPDVRKASGLPAGVYQLGLAPVCGPQSEMNLNGRQSLSRTRAAEPTKEYTCQRGYPRASLTVGF